jgi:hypothetical protein
VPLADNTAQRIRRNELAGRFVRAVEEVSMAHEFINRTVQTV